MNVYFFLSFWFIIIGITFNGTKLKSITSCLLFDKKAGARFRFDMRNIGSIATNQETTQILRYFKFIDK